MSNSMKVVLTSGKFHEGIVCRVCEKKIEGALFIARQKRRYYHPACALRVHVCSEEEFESLRDVGMMRKQQVKLARQAAMSTMREMLREVKV